jgi:peptidyl-prolyl cis-trans isomerase SurA
VKNLLLASLLILPALARAEQKPAAAASQTIERVSAVVNDAVILESEVVQRSQASLAELDTAEPNERAREWKKILRRSLDSMVDEELIVEAAEEAKLEVTDDEVQKALDEIKRQNHLTDKQLEAALNQQGTTLSSYRKDVRRQILRLRAISMLVRPRVSVGDEDVKAKYERMAGQSAVVTEVHLRHILLALPERPGTAAVDAARRRAGDLVDRARAGEDFVGLAKEASADPATKGDGGDLGWYKRGELPTEWEEIVFAMEPNEVRGPIQGPRGLHIFQLVENKKESVRPFAEVKDQLRESIFQEEMEKQTKVWLQELRKKAHVEVKI